MNPSNEIVLNRQLAKLYPARRQGKGSESDAVIYSVASNEDFDVASYNKARVLRIYQEDVWFTSNIALPKGQYVCLGFNMNESDPVFNSNEFQPVRIKGRTDTHDTSQRYRYQARYINSNSAVKKVSHKPHVEKQGQRSIRLHADKDPRHIPRKSCYQAIIFYSKNKKYQGILTNLSRKGAYIETNNNLFFRQKIEIEVPVNPTKEGFRLLGKVIRVDLNGVGLQLNRIIDTRRSGRQHRLFSAGVTNRRVRTANLSTAKVCKKFHNSVH